MKKNLIHSEGINPVIHASVHEKVKSPPEEVLLQLLDLEEFFFFS